MAPVAIMSSVFEVGHLAGTLDEHLTLLSRSTYPEIHVAAQLKELVGLDLRSERSCRPQPPPAAGQLLWHTFQVRMEFDITLFFVFLGVLVALSSRKRRNSLFAVVLEILSSFYLLYATYNRNFIIKHTDIAQWISSGCSEGAGALIYQYIIFSVVSWMASSLLEFSSSFHLAKLSYMKLRKSIRFTNFQRSSSRFVVLGATTIFTFSSLVLTLVLWGLVHKSLGLLAQEVTVLAFLTIAAFLRLIRQLMEGVTLITGIATGEFKWRNPNSKILFGRIAFSSFMLLIHSSSLTHICVTGEEGLGDQALCHICWTLC